MPLNNTDSNHFDYIITGAGCAGLSLLMHIFASGGFSQKKILLLDQDQKNKNDRTWCFWEQEQGLFEPVVYKQWKQLQFASRYFSGNLDIAPYTYKLIRGKDFYQYCFQRIKEQPNVTWMQLPVEQIGQDKDLCHVTAGQRRFSSDFIFNSIMFEKPELKKNEYWLLQHFAGSLVESEVPVFDPAAATLMDFNTDQIYGTTFFYVLPFSENQALVEYTIFSGEVLPPAEYNSALQNYLTGNLNLQKFSVLETEFGVIPMTNMSFSKRDEKIINIGTAGGQTKGSSGYTFQFIQKSSASIVRALMAHKHPAHYLSMPGRFRFYDSVLLNILKNKKLGGDYIFAELFRHNNPSAVLRFLDNETSLLQELKLIKSLPIGLFSKAALQHARLSI